MSDDTLQLRAQYMDAAFGDLDSIAKDLKQRLEYAKLKVDTLVGTGLSGALVVPAVARILSLHWVVVRKSIQSSHSTYPFEGTLGKHWLFVDDRIETGTTLHHVKDFISAAVRSYGRNGFKTKYTGSFTYMYPTLRDM